MVSIYDIKAKIDKNMIFLKKNFYYLKETTIYIAWFQILVDSNIYRQYLIILLGFEVCDTILIYNINWYYLLVDINSSMLNKGNNKKKTQV